MSVIAKIAEALDTLKFTRRFGFFATIFVTLQATYWSFQFPYDALEKGLAAGEVALILGAVMGPITMLQGFVINAYFNRGTQNVITASTLQANYSPNNNRSNQPSFVQVRSTDYRDEVSEGVTRV